MLKKKHERHFKSQQFLKTKQNRNNYRTDLCDREKQKNNQLLSIGRETKGSFAQLKCFNGRLKSPLIEINCANAPPKHELSTRRARNHVRAVTHFQVNQFTSLLAQVSQYYRKFITLKSSWTEKKNVLRWKTCDVLNPHKCKTPYVLQNSPNHLRKKFMTNGKDN